MEALHIHVTKIVKYACTTGVIITAIVMICNTIAKCLTAKH